MVDRSSPPSGGSASATPVVLCCATGEAEALAPLVRALEQRGNAVDLVEGVDARTLGVAIEQRAGAGVYVLVRSGALDREQVDALREVLLARRIPFGRTLTVSGTKTDDLLDRIGQSLKRQVAQAPGARAPAPVDATGRTRRTTAVIPAAPAKPAPVAAAKPAAPARPATPRPGPLPAPRSTPTRTSPAPSKPAATESVATAIASERVASTASEPPSSTPTLTGSAPEEPPSSTPTLPGAAARDVGEAATPSTERSAAEEQTRALAVSEDVAPGQAMVGELVSVVAPMPQPDTSATAMELDADLVEEVSIHPARHDDDDEPSVVDLAGVLDGIGVDAIDRTVPGRRIDTVVAPAVAFEGYPDDDIELSLRDGVIVDDDEKVDVTQIVRSPLPGATTTPSRAAPRTTTLVAPAVAEESSRGRYIAAAVVAALGLGVLGAVMVSRDDDGDASTVAAASTAASKVDAAPPPSTPNAEPAKPEPAKADDAKADDAKPDDAKPDDAKPDDAKPDDAKPDDAEAEPAKPELLAQADIPAVPDAKTPPALADASALATKPETPRGSGLYTVAARKAERARPIPPARTEVLKALRARSIRALDVLLVTRRATAPMAAKAAGEHCDALELDGLDHWRLPEIGELASLTDAGIIGRGFYWSSTAGDTFGDSRMAWNGAKRQGGVRYKSSAVVCVRGDRSDGG